MAGHRGTARNSSDASSKTAGGNEMRQCVREDGKPKMTYLTKDEAKRALRRLPGSEATGWTRWYECNNCGYYHIGRLG